MRWESLMEVASHHRTDPQARGGAMPSADPAEVPLAWPAERSIPALPRTRPYTILLAEDDADLREVTTTILEMWGYAVVACENGRRASEVFRSRADIDFLLTDLEMPERTGIELAREVTALKPSLPIVIVSGSILPVFIKQEIQHRDWKFFSKPYGLPVLLESISALLQSASDDNAIQS